MNMQSIMAQAQKMQRELEKVSKEIEETEFDGENGAVKVKVKGDYKVIDVLISDDDLDKEMIQDMIMLATNDALSKIKKMKNEKLGRYTGGLGGLL